MRRREFIASATAGLAVTQASGCALLRDLLNAAFQRPRVSVRSMRILDMSLDTVRTEFDTLIENPNPFGVSLAGLAYGLSIEGSRFASGDLKKGLSIKAQGRSTTKFPVDLSLGKTANAILALIQKNEVGYGLDSRWTFQIPKIAQPVTIPVDFSGRLPMPKIPPLTVSNFAFRNVSASGIGVRVTTRIQNPNAFEIPIDSFGFDVKLNNRSVLRNRRVEGLRLAAGRGKTVPLDFDIGLVDLGLSAAEMVSRPNLNWQLEADVKSGKLSMPFTQNGTVRLQ